MRKVQIWIIISKKTEFQENKQNLENKVHPEKRQNFASQVKIITIKINTINTMLLSFAVPAQECIGSMASLM